MVKNAHTLFWLSEIEKEEEQVVGKKAVHFGELTRRNIPIPEGFVIPTSSYFDFIKSNNITTKITHLLKSANFQRPETLTQIAEYIRKTFVEAEPSQEFIRDLFKYYNRLSPTTGQAVVSITPEVVTEGLKHTHFPIPIDSTGTIQGEATLLQRIKATWAGMFSAPLLLENHKSQYDLFYAGLSLIIQETKESLVHGKIFTIDPVHAEKNIIVTATSDQHKTQIDKHVNEQRFTLDKNTLALQKKHLSSQQAQIISDDVVVELAQYAKTIEEYSYFPQEIFWSSDGGKVFITNLKPLSTHETKPSYLAKGTAVHPGVRSGPVKILRSSADAYKVLAGDIIVAHETDINFERAMKKAQAVITEKNGPVSHAAAFGRQHGIPTIVGVPNATKIFKTDQTITVDGIKGEIKKGGVLKSRSVTDEIKKDEQKKTATKLYVSLSDLQTLNSLQKENIDGILLLDSNKFLQTLGTHPKKLLKDGHKDIFVQKLAHFIEQACSFANPKYVLYRFTDLTTKEYTQLIGGKDYESVEQNPVLGYHGAMRMIHEKETFALELEALQLLRNKRKINNLSVVLPSVRTVQELGQIKHLLAEYDLNTSSACKQWLLLQTPANVILLYQYIQEGIDGVIISLPDITSLLLGIDHANPEMALYFQQTNEAVTWSISHVAHIAQKFHIPSLLHAPATMLNQTILENALKQGITGISVDAQVIHTMHEHVLSIEKNNLK